MTNGTRDPTGRFSDRVEDYLRYRPGYPEAMLDVLQAETGLSPGSVVADVGAGTGISAELLLRRGCSVYAVEPNREMRLAAERRLGGGARFRSVAATAEDTTLPAGSVDIVTAGQAFHWFDPERARREFARILRPGGWVALFWNSRRTGATPFLQAYEALLQEYATDYAEVNHRNLGPRQLGAFFGGEYRAHTFDNQQEFDLEGLKGRLLSSSYAPAAGHPRHEPMLRALREAFEAHQAEGRVRFLYDTELYLGRLTG